jgi:CDP-paratose 2-epimerase
LIGSEVCRYFDGIGWKVHGIDNNMRAEFFGPMGDTRWNQLQLQKELRHFNHSEIDIRDRNGISQLIDTLRPQAIVHTAAQPSHDLAAKIPYDDFDTNAVGTLNLLEAARQYAPDVVFVHMSTNKVYGDGPNRLRLIEQKKRWDFDDPLYSNGIKESFPVDQSKHSLFGASKLAADIMVQEYGRYFGMPTCCLRGGCLTGPNHAGVQLHGFLSYLIQCNRMGEKYTVFGYKGKQVRDNIHSYDVARFIHAFIQAPQCAEVYNIGGGRDNSCSILEAFDLIESISGKPMVYEYSETAREGDHICYISNLEKMKTHYPNWDITKSLHVIFEEIYASYEKRLSL